MRQTERERGEVEIKEQEVCRIELEEKISENSGG